MKNSKLFALLAALMMVIAVISGCAAPAEQTPSDAPASEPAEEPSDAPADEPSDAPADGEVDWTQYHIGFSQDWNSIEWTQAMRDDIIATCDQYGIKCTVTDAGNSGEKQISDIEDLITLGVDAILISTYHADTIGNATQAAMDAGIPVIVLSSEIPGIEPTCIISADAVATGEACGKYVQEKFPEGGKIIQISGKEGSVVNQNRGIGFRNIIDADSKFEVLEEMACNYERSLALTTMEDFLHVYGEEIDIVYCHNDDMALGVIQAIVDAGYEANVDGGIFVISAADGIYEEVLDAVEEGKMVSAKYPTFGVEGVETAMKIFAGETVEPKMIVDSPLITKENVADFR